MTRTAVLFGLLAMVAWGGWAVVADLATRSVAPEVAVVISYAASVLLAAGYILVRGVPFSVDGTGLGLAALSGVFGGIGVISFYAGLEAGRTGVVTTVSALYFVVAAVLGVLLLGESLSVRDVLGVAFAVAAVVLLAR